MQTTHPTVTLLVAERFVLVGILSGFSRFERKSSIRFTCLFTVNETGTGGQGDGQGFFQEITENLILKCKM